jgi:hypothetical protein
MNETQQLIFGFVIMVYMVWALYNYGRGMEDER